jgi:hypothetical protein
MDCRGISVRSAWISEFTLVAAWTTMCHRLEVVMPWGTVISQLIMLDLCAFELPT